MESPSVTMARESATACTSMPSRKYHEEILVASGKIRRSGHIAVGDEVVLVGESVIGFGAHHLRRQIKADGEIGERRTASATGSEKNSAPGGMFTDGCSTKSDGVIEAGLNASVARAHAPHARR